MKYLNALVITCLTLTTPVFAQNLKVAAASNLKLVIKDLADDFKQKTGITIETTIGPSGSLAAQIKGGGPFEVFLSADMDYPESLFKAGLSSKEPASYAEGKLIVCSKQDVGIQNWLTVLKTDKVKKIGVPNPATSPYGKAAEEALNKKAIYADVKPKIVYAEGSSEVNASVFSGANDVGFTSQSVIKDTTAQLFFKVIDPDAYTKLSQGIVVLKKGESNPSAQKFYDYILSADAKSIFQMYGYQ